MKKDYLIAHLRVHEKDGFEKFRQMAQNQQCHYDYFKIVGIKQRV